MHRQQIARAALGVGVALTLAACSTAASPSATANRPESSPAASASAAPSEATTSAATTSAPPTDGSLTYDPASILLQFDATPDAVLDSYGDSLNDGIGGNLWFVPGPDFTLYGDGTAIFRDDEAARAAPGREGRSFAAPAMSIGQLSAAQVQAVLDHAWSDGGLAEAKEHYPTDAQDLFISASFTIAAGDRHKHVQLDGLFTDAGGADASDRERLVALAEYLRHLDTSIDFDAQPWHPERYWGSLREVDTSFVGNPTDGWPWANIEPGGWLGGRRSLTPSDVAAIGRGDLPGGYCCHLMSGPGDEDPPYFAYGLTITPMWPERIQTDAVAEVVTTDLVVRTEPGTDASTSQILKPALAAPQLLYIVDGPVAADGYDWYLVEPFAPDHLPHPPLPHGWLAAGGRDGEPWIASATLACPPASLDAISGLSELARLVCYGDQALTLEGTFGGCVVSSPVHTSPAWLAHSACGLYPDGYREDVVPGTGWLAMRLNGVPLDAQPDDRISVEGHFDDPAARTCTTRAIDGEPVPIPELVVLWCRTQFVPTAVSAP